MPVDLPSLFAAISPERLRATCGEDPSFWCREVFDASEDRTLAGLADTLIGTPLALVAILIVAVLINRLARRSIRGGLRRLHSGAVAERLGNVRRFTPDALSGVLRSVASFAIFLIAGFVALGRLGVDLAPLLASAGIVGVALGFGSQTLVKDFLSGIFILIEDQYGVGDIVNLDGETSGTVESVSLRTTRLRSVDGTVWHVPNGEIRRAGNQSQHWSRSLLDIEVAYDTDIDRAKTVLQDVADRAWKEDEDIIEPPEVWGIEALGASGITVRVVVKTRPSEQYRVSRMLREHIKAAFDAEGIEIPFPQQTVWHRPLEEAGA